LSYKILLGLIAGVLAGISIPVIIKYRKEEDLFSDEDLSHQNILLDKANRYLINARNEATKIIDHAEEKSHSLVEQAGKILSTAKEKTTRLHDLLKKGNETEIMKLKDSIEEDIKELNRIMNMNNE
jgi:F0F1-type ATP synthase membrane subunit b/b'